MNLFLQATLTTQQSGLISPGTNFLDDGLKWLLIVCFALYVAFAFVVTRQITIMRKTLITPFAPVLTTFGYIHFAVSLFFLIFFTFVL